MTRPLSKKRPVKSALEKISLAPHENVIFRRYTRIKNRTLVQLHVKDRDMVQTFTLDVRPETAMEADFMRKMLARAVAKIIVEETVESKYAATSFLGMYDEAH